MTATSGFNLEDILEKLPNESFLSLHSSFGLGVVEDDFVEILLGECRRHSKELATEEGRSLFEPKLRQLFTIIDVNSNGQVSWEEFSHYVMYAVQAPEVSEKKEIVQHLAFDYLGRCPVESTRLRSAQVDFTSIWDKYILLECGATSSRLALYTKHANNEIPFRTYAEHCTSTLLESMCFVDSLRLVAATTTNGKLQMFDVSDDPVLEEAEKMQRLRKVREHHLEGRNTVLRFDPETQYLFAGSRDGIVTIINPEDDTRVVPAVVQQVRLHKQPILDLCVLPERGNKKLLTTALDGKIQMYDIVRTEFYGELGSAVAAHSMSFCEEYSVLVTCSHKDLDPLMWAPHAVSNVYVGRLESSKPGHRSRLVSALCPKGTPYCFTTDVQGQIKLWDLRKLKQVVGVYADGDAFKHELSPQLTMRSLTADPRTLDAMAFCRSEFGNGLEFLKSNLVSTRDPCLAHDDQVVGCTVAKPSGSRSGWLCTASEDCVKLWDQRTGEVLHHFKNFLPETERISAFTTDGDGRRVFAGTQSGSLFVVSTSTCGMIAECPQQLGSIVTLQLRGDMLVALSSDGSVTATDISGDAPKCMFSCRRDVVSKGMCLDVSSHFSCIVTGFENGWLELNDCAEHSHGACMGRIRPQESSKSAEEDDDVAAYMLPEASEITAVRVCAPRAFVCYGDTRGGLHIVAIRPHPRAMTRMSWWRTFFPRATTTFFAVPLSIEWREESCTLIVGDDQGNITLWDCSDILAKYAFVPCSFPAPMKEILSLPKPKETPLVFNPKLRGYFTVSPTLTPIRQLKLLTKDLFYFVDEKSVHFGTVFGDIVGSLQQGRGTILGTNCDEFNVFGNENTNGDVQADELASSCTLDQTARSDSSLGSSFAGSKADIAPFTIISDSLYRDLCRSSRAASYRSSQAAAGGKLQVQDDIPFDADTPPCTPNLRFHVKSRVLSKYPRPVSAITSIGGEPDANAEKYFSPLKSTLSTQNASPFAQPTRTVAEGDDHFSHARTEAGRIVTLVRERLERLTEGLVLSSKDALISTRVQPPLLREPTMSAVFSADLSFCFDWRSKLLQHPHRVVWLQRSVTDFTQNTLTAPKSSLVVGSVVDLTAKKPRKNFGETAPRALSTGSLLRRHQSTFQRPNNASNDVSAPPTGRVVPKADAPVDEPSLAMFQLPVALNTTWQDSSRDAILKSVAEKIDKEHERRQARQKATVRHVSAPETTERALRSIILHRTSTPEPKVDRHDDEVIAQPLRPMTPALQYGRSETINQMRPSQWNGATHIRPSSSSSASVPTRSPSAQPRTATTGSSSTVLKIPVSASSERRDYVQFLMHLPRLKEALRVSSDSK
jgi:WD40 repeat protein